METESEVWLPRAEDGNGNWLQNLKLSWDDGRKNYLICVFIYCQSVIRTLTPKKSATLVCSIPRP